MDSSPEEGVECIRQHLRRVAEREGSLGIPVGCILFKKSTFGLLKKAWKKEGLGTFAIKKFQDIQAHEDFAIVHLGVQTAAAVAVIRQRGGSEDGRLQAVLEATCGEYYPGVRPNDAFLNHQIRGIPPIAASPAPAARFTFAEIFAGIGGFRLGMQPLGGTCVYASEIDLEAQKTYAANFGDSELIGDITNTYACDLPACDILTAGFPCQSFSIRGEKGGLDDPRGRLYLELVRVLKGCRPKAFIFENVANLVYIDGGKRGEHCKVPEPNVIGRTFEIILLDFRACGYDVDWRIVDSSPWIPQSRERVYLVGVRNDLRADPVEHMDWALDYRSDIFINQAHQNSTVRDIMVPPDHQDIHLCVLTSSQHERITSEEFRKQVYPDVEPEPGCENWVLQIDKKAPTLVSGYRSTSSYSTKYIFTDKNGDKLDVPRFFTHLECLRVMGFPDEFIIPKSVAKQYNSFYKQIGNAVCPPVINSIAAEVLKLLLKAEKGSADAACCSRSAPEGGAVS